MKKLFTMIALSAMAFSLTACGGDDCEDAADRMTDAYDECGIDVGGDGDAEGGDAECSDELGEAAQCQADCVEAAPCGALDLSDLEAATEMGTCMAACSS